MARVLARRLIGSGAAVAAFVACSALAGCSSNKGATAPPAGEADGGLDGSSAPVTDGSTPPSPDASGTVTPGDAGPRATACTAAPFVAFGGTLSLLDVSGAAQPLAGATIGFSTCPGFVITTDATGSASTQLTKGVPLSPIYNGGAAVLSAIGAELPATSDVTTSVTLFAFDVSPAIPGFQRDGGDAPTIAVSLQVEPAATAPCNDVSGVTLAVTGHPEAVVSYANTSWPANQSVTTTSSTGPYVFVNGVQGATKVALSGAKTGCSVTLVSAAQTGSFLLVAGSVTAAVATVGN